MGADIWKWTVKTHISTVGRRMCIYFQCILKICEKLFTAPRITEALMGHAVVMLRVSLRRDPQCSADGSAMINGGVWCRGTLMKIKRLTHYIVSITNSNLPGYVSTSSISYEAIITYWWWLVIVDSYSFKMTNDGIPGHLFALGCNYLPLT